MDYEDVRLQFEEFKKMKPELEFGQVPVIEINGKRYTQSMAILRYLGQKYGYYPTTDPEAAYQIDSTMDGIGDYVTKYVAIRSEQDAEKKEKLMGDFVVFLDSWLTVFDKRLLANTTQKYLVGDKISVADFAMFRVGYGYFFNDAFEQQAKIKPVLEKHEVMNKYLIGLGDEMKDYLEKRPKPRPI